MYYILHRDKQQRDHKYLITPRHKDVDGRKYTETRYNLSRYKSKGSSYVEFSEIVKNEVLDEGRRRTR
jgi:hypothetical protein